MLCVLTCLRTCLNCMYLLPSAPPSYAEVVTEENRQSSLAPIAAFDDFERALQGPLFAYIQEFRFLPPPLYSEVGISVRTWWFMYCLCLIFFFFFFWISLGSCFSFLKLGETIKMMNMEKVGFGKDFCLFVRCKWIASRVFHACFTAWVTLFLFFFRFIFNMNSATLNLKGALWGALASLSCYFLQLQTWKVIFLGSTLP